MQMCSYHQHFNKFHILEEKCLNFIDVQMLVMSVIRLAGLSNFMEIW
jgi:hypothetical protein